MYWKMFKKQKLEELENASQENKVDDSITPLLNILNKHENIVTTSSCYGRIVLLEYDLKKGKKKKKKKKKKKEKKKNPTKKRGGFFFGGGGGGGAPGGSLLWFKVEPL